MKKIINSIKVGDPLTYTDLIKAIEFYTLMSDGLNELGPEFALAERDVRATLRKLESFKYHRDTK